MAPRYTDVVLRTQWQLSRNPFLWQRRIPYRWDTVSRPLLEQTIAVQRRSGFKEEKQKAEQETTLSTTIWTRKQPPEPAIMAVALMVVTIAGIMLFAAPRFTYGG